MIYKSLTRIQSLTKVNMLTSVGFIGAGMMASALMDCLVSKGIVTSPANISCSDVWEQARANASAKGYFTTDSNTVVCQRVTDAVVLAVKPNVVEDACLDIATIPSEALVISIAAGIPLEKLESWLPNRRVVRVMPNTPCVVGEAASGFALGKLATENDGVLVKSIFGSVGIALEVDESNLDAVTGLSGSGPAYVFQFIEALSDAGVRVGLPRSVATQLAAQTVKGAAEMVLQTGKHPGSLKDGVASPGGTTIAGIEALEKGGFRAATISAVVAATKRSMQLGGIPSDEISHKHGL
jgi:pyrroline-5-carboxylate reductase